MLKIIRQSVVFPGGYAYTQAESGFKVNGALLTPTAKILLAHRKGNNFPNATLEQCTADIVLACCTRHPSLCINDGVVISSDGRVVSYRANQTAAPKKRRCGSCGGKAK